MQLTRVGTTLLLGAMSMASPSGAQVLETDLRGTVFAEPSPTSELIVVHPGVRVAGQITEQLSISAGYDADIVTGATESIKAGALSGVDVVSSATSFDDVRHAPSAGFFVERESTRFGGSYAHGIESDYESNSFMVTAGADFFQNNTTIDIAYAHGFDRVCTAAFSEALPTTSRPALDSSAGCFADSDTRELRSIDLDNYQAAWTQDWTPVFSTQLQLTAQLQHGWLGNPYRSVVIAPSGDTALENHPENRARAALQLQAKYFIRHWNSALTVRGRLYRDTWDIWSGTYAVALEKNWNPWLRLLGRARFHQQSGALFWSDDYTGGEPVSGPRGQYWTGDRELSPLLAYAVGARALATARGRVGDRLFGMLLEGQAGLALDVMKTDLEQFTWGGVRPDDTWGLLLTLTLSGTF